MKHVGQHAIVIGASMSGLLAARALSDAYAVVTVLERDALPRSDIPRKGVPQGRHAHGLLARGRAVIENFFPGWTNAVVACGGVRGDIAGDVKLDRSWRYHQVCAERSGRTAGFPPRAGRQCSPPPDGAAECARDRKLRSAGTDRRRWQNHDQGRSRPGQQRRRARDRGRPRRRCFRPRFVEPGLAGELRLRKAGAKSGSKSGSATPRAPIAAVRPIWAASSRW